MEEKQKQAIKEIGEILESGTREFRSSEKWQEYLTMQSKMPDYSYNNCLLILLQTQGQASMCMGYKSWKQLGRYVKAGENGIKIICPAPKRIEVWQEKKDAEGNLICHANGIPVREKVTRVIPYYKVGYTFDVSQTNGKPLPEICSRLEGGVAGAKELIEILQKISPVPMTFEMIEGRANGYFSPLEQKIVIKEGLSPNHTIHTCLHEITHAILSLNGTDAKVSRELKETEAESVAFVVMKRLLGDQLTTEELGQYSFGYLNSWASSDDLSEMQEAMQTIQKTSMEIINQIEKELKMRDLEKASEQVQAVPVELESDAVGICAKTVESITQPAKATSHAPHM